MRKLLALGVILLTLIIAGGCTTKQAQHFVGSAIADGADTQVRYNDHQCRILRQQCVQGDFQEWETSEKEMGWSFKKL